MVIDPEMVAELKDLLGLDFGLFLETFKADLMLRCDAIMAAIAAADADAVRLAAHSLKGSSSNFGAVQLSDACALLEDQAVNHDLSNAKALLDAILQQKNAVLIAIQALA